LVHETKYALPLHEVHQQWFNQVNSAGEDEKDRGEKQRKNNLPKSIRLRATILVNLRPTVGIQVNYFMSYFEEYNIAICSNAMKIVNSK
jgi:hypothetical protein